MKYYNANPILESKRENAITQAAGVIVFPTVTQALYDCAERRSLISEGPMTMNSIQELAELREVHACTLRLLAEVADFLVRLPPVPVTRELAMRIESHITDPRTAATNEAARLNDARLLHGGEFTAAGLLLLQLEIEGDQARLSTGIPKSPRGQAEALEKLLCFLRSRPSMKMKPGLLPRT